MWRAQLTVEGNWPEYKKITIAAIRISGCLGAEVKMEIAEFNEPMDFTKHTLIVQEQLPEQFRPKLAISVPLTTGITIRINDAGYMNIYATKKNVSWPRQTFYYTI